MKRMAEMRANRAAPPFSESIESRDNRWLKRFRAALSGDSSRGGASARARADSSPQALPEGEIAGVEGARLVETALHSSAEILALLFSDTGAKHMRRLQPSIPPGARLLRTTDRLFAFASGTETPQGVAALVRPRLGTFDDLIGGTPLILILAGVQDPGNVGTLVRTAEALGASGVAACAVGAIGTANPFSPKALRAWPAPPCACPSCAGFPRPCFWRNCASPAYASAPLAPTNLPALAAAPTRAPAPENRSRRGRSIGAARGPADRQRRRRPARRLGPLRGYHRAHPHAPQYTKAGRKCSRRILNAAIAGSILLYEAARQRGLNS